MKKAVLPIIIVTFFAASCQQHKDASSLESPGLLLTWAEPDSLPFAVSNNAVASAEVNGGGILYSFLGLEQGKTYLDVTPRAAMFNPSTQTSVEIAPLTDSTGRLASTAETVNGFIYIFGGYTVAEDGSEKSTPEVFRFNPANNEYEVISTIPTPVDDAVSLVYQNRYVYLVSGWHDHDNVDLVQVYDTRENSWRQATPWPGPPVFGHTGGIAGNEMVVIDGVKVVPGEERRSFEISPVSFKGTINPDDYTQITWKKLGDHPGRLRYRAAAEGITEPEEMILFIGGSDNAYNYTGIGYNGEPSEPADTVFAYHLPDQKWITLGTQPVPTMDHRNIAKIENRYYVAGGMTAGQTLTNKIFSFTIEKP